MGKEQSFPQILLEQLVILHKKRNLNTYCTLYMKRKPKWIRGLSVGAAAAKSLQFLKQGTRNMSNKRKKIINWRIHQNLRRLTRPFQVVLVVKNSPAKAGGIRDVGWIPGWEDPLKKCMTTHSRILAQKIQWTGEPGGPQSIGSQRVRHD